MSNIVTFSHNPMTQAIIQNPKLLAEIRKQEKAVLQSEAKAIKALEKEHGTSYPNWAKLFEKYLS